MYFWKGFYHGEKVDLGKGHWNLKRKIWVTTHFSEIRDRSFFYEVGEGWWDLRGGHAKKMASKGGGSQKNMGCKGGGSPKKWP